MVKLSEMELKMLIKGGETNTVELKLAAPRAVDLAERLCGMANARGGIVIIGVEDSTHKVVGVPDERIGETMDVILRAVRQVIKPELVLDPPEPEVYVLAGKKLFVVTIPPTDGPVYQAGGIFWIRQGTQTRALSMAELSEMIYDRGLRDWELEPAYNATMEDIDLEKVKAFIAQRSASGRQSDRFKNIERVLVGMRCAVEVSDGTIVPTNAGVLFFGYSPQDHIPQSEVVCVLFRETVGASRYADRKIVTGTLQDLIDGTEAFLNRYIAVGARIEGWKRRRLGRSLQPACPVCQLQASFLSASRSGQFYLPAQTMSMRCSLTGELTGEPIDNKRFSTKLVESERGERAWNRRPRTSVDE